MRLGPLKWAGVIVLALVIAPNLVLPGFGVVLMVGLLALVVVAVVKRQRWIR
ncbi:hypothetical protein AB0M12_41780 [Nocardia vinacea]|uniref:hypothetical protein n=1 Tax=Nocardia vinacea TaxID=96468 RepID=UPI00343A3CDE